MTFLHGIAVFIVGVVCGVFLIGLVSLNAESEEMENNDKC